MAAAEPVQPSTTAKGKRKASEASAQDEDAASDADSSDSSNSDAEGGGEDADEPTWHSEAQDKGKEPSRPKAGDWEAIWSAEHNAYYFHNTVTKATTWDNPTTTKARAPVAPSTEPSIDPALAYLEPSLQAQSSGGAGGAVSGRFNSRTGKFEGDPNRNPEYHSDFSRAKRQSQFFFDVDAWEKQREMDQAQAAQQGEQKHKPPTKKELAAYKAKRQDRKKAKLMAKYGD